jgi:hypothetical protein
MRGEWGFSACSGGNPTPPRRSQPETIGIRLRWRSPREQEAALDLNQRLKRLAWILPGGIDDPGWQDFEPAARSALVEIGLEACWAHADRAGAMGLPPSHIRAVARRATLEAVES